MTYRDIIAVIGMRIAAGAVAVGLWAGIIIACLALTGCGGVPYQYGGTSGLSSDPYVREQQLNRAAVERGNRQNFVNSWSAPYGHQYHGTHRSGSYGF